MPNDIGPEARAHIKEVHRNLYNYDRPHITMGHAAQVVEDEIRNQKSGVARGIVDEGAMRLEDSALLLCEATGISPRLAIWIITNRALMNNDYEAFEDYMDEETDWRIEEDNNE